LLKRIPEGCFGWIWRHPRRLPYTALYDPDLQESCVKSFDLGVAVVAIALGALGCSSQLPAAPSANQSSAQIPSSAPPSPTQSSTPTPTSSAAITGLNINGLPFLTVGGIGDVIQLAATAVLSDGTQQVLSKVEWSVVSVDPIAIISPGGVLTLTHAGDAEVKASYAGLTASKSIFVMIDPAPVTNGKTEHIQGHNVCAERPHDPRVWNGGGRKMLEFRVNSDGVANLVGGRNPFDIGGATAIYRLSPNGELIEAPYSNHASAGHEFDVRGGYDYVLSMLGDVERCPYDYDIILQHPN
jgi:hypothetical protein